MAGVGTQKGKQEYLEWPPPTHEEQSLAARATWVSAHAMSNVLCPSYQAWPTGTPLSPEVLAQDSLWDSARVANLCGGQGRTPNSSRARA